MRIPRLVSAVQDRRTLFCATVLIILLVSSGSVGAYDLWWHLKAGENIVQTGRIPHEDQFSFTAPAGPWTYHSWLSGVVLYEVHSFAGLKGLVLLRGLLMAGSLMVSWAAARRRGVGAGLASMLVLAACFQLQARALIRPHLFSFVLFSITYLLVQQAFEGGAPPARVAATRFGAERRFLWGRGGRLILLPLLTLLWANLHGGFLVGLLMIGAYGAAEMVRVAVQERDRHYLRELLVEGAGARFRALLATGVLCLAAGAVTPYGPGTLTYPFRLMREVKLVRQVEEWQAMPLTASFAVFWVLLGLTIAALVLSISVYGRRGDLRHKAGQLCADALVVLGFGLLAVRSARNLEWVMLLVAPVLGYHIVALRHAAASDLSAGEADRRKERIYALASYTLCAVIAIHRVAGGGFSLGVSEDRLPVRACDYLARTNLPGRFYNEYAWGGYLIWRFSPERRVFIDGRCLVYGDPVMGEALTVANGRDGWEDILEKHQVEGLLIRHQSHDSKHFFRSGKWCCVYWDDTALVAISESAALPQPPAVEQFPLSNPAVFEDRLADSAPEAILDELDRVVAMNPDCWRAWTFRASCLLKMAKADEEGRAGLLEEALSAALRARQLNDRAPETRRALRMCREAQGALSGPGHTGP